MKKGNCSGNCSCCTRCDGEEKENKIFIIIRLISAVVLFIGALAVDKLCGLKWYYNLIIYGVVYLWIGYDILYGAVRNIFVGRVFTERFLMTVASVGAFVLREFPEGVAVMLLYQLGEFLQDCAVDKSRKSIASLMNIKPEKTVVIKDGKETEIKPEDVKVGDVLVVRAGEKISLDGVVVEGNSSLNTQALTGESMPVDVKVGDNVLSGSINISGVIYVKATTEYKNSTVSKILHLVENASERKAKTENFIDKFAKIYTPVVVFVAVLLAIVPSLITGSWALWCGRSLTFLVSSCPCALVISVPLAFFGGIGCASRKGILIKGSNYLEELNNARTFVFDKTGTLTKGKFEVVDVYPTENAEKVLKTASIAESFSNHPIAKSICEKAGNYTEKGFAVEEISGKGIKAVNGERVIFCGNEKLMQEFGVEYTTNDKIGSMVYVAENGKFVGSIVVADVVKNEAKEIIKGLKDGGARVVMLTGDNYTTAEKVATELGIDEFRSGLLPNDKVECVDKLTLEQGEKESLVFVGDGINDAPVLMTAEVGVSMGGVGSDSAIEASDIVLMKDDLHGIGLAKKIAKKTIGIVKENVIFSLAVKLAVMTLTAVGVIGIGTGMWLAVIADVGVAMIAICNAMRTMKIK